MAALLSGLCALLSAAPPAVALSFTPHPSAVGTWPASVVTADFNGDGHADTATANFVSNDVSVSLGNGAGALSPAPGSPVPAGNAPVSLAAGDFNGDGRQDLASANFNSNDVTILLGNGGGAFSPAPGPSPTAGDGPVSVTSGDFNRDGRQDLAIANYRSGGITVLLGDGAGGFAPAAGSPLPTGSGPSSVKAGDLNRDGRPDLAVANLEDDNVTLLLGNGSGGFAPAPGSPFAMGDGPVSLVLADFDRDGRLDVATADGNSSVLSVRLGTGTGGLGSVGNTPLGGQPFSATAGDLDGDGIPDLALANANSDNVRVLLGNGGGGFIEAAGSPVPSGDGSYSVALDDFNGDGRADVVTANLNAGAVNVLVNTSDFAAFNYFAPAGRSQLDDPTAVTVADFNRDGRDDLAVANEGSDQVTVAAGDGAGHFGAWSAYGVSGAGPAAIATGDFNRDGSIDLTTANRASNDISSLAGNGDGTFGAAAVTPLGGTAPGGIATGDFNRDGADDIATANSGSDTVSTLLGDGSGGFSPSVSAPTGAARPAAVATGDLNGDGKPDLATANESADNVSIMIGDGAGGFSAAATHPHTGSAPVSIAIGDFNGDGHQDIATANRAGNSVTVLAGDGAGGFAAVAEPAVGQAPVSIATGDFNRDGHEDLVTANSGSDDLSILLGNGSGAFTRGFGSQTAAGDGPVSVAPGKFNGDGAEDVVALNRNSHDLTVHLGALDRTAPATQDDVPAAYQGQDVRVTLTASDVGAGVAQTYYTTGASPSTPTTSSAVYDPLNKPLLHDGERISYFSTDTAGNAEAPSTSEPAKVDKTAPTTHDDVPAAYQAQDVRVTLTASDAGAGVAQTYYTTGANPTTPTTTSAVYDPLNKPLLHDGERISYFSTDTLGNSEAPSTSEPARVDKTAPVSQASAPALTNTRAVTVSYSADDASSGLARVDLYVRGPGDTAFSLADTDTTPPPDEARFAYLATEGDGDYSFFTVAHDNAGNVEEAPPIGDVVVTVDTAAPLVALSDPSDGSSTIDATPTITGAAATGSHDGSSVAVKLYAGSAAIGLPIATMTASPDPASGHFSVEPAAPLPLGTYAVAASQTDDAGNTGRSATHVFNVVAPVQDPPPLTGPEPDVVPPAITIAFPVENAAVVRGSLTRVDYSCSDGSGSGLASCGGPIASGAQISTATIGRNAFTVTSADHAGNTAVKTVHYTVLSEGRVRKRGPAQTRIRNGRLTIDTGFLGVCPDTGPSCRVLLTARVLRGSKATTLLASARVTVGGAAEKKLVLGLAGSGGRVLRQAGKTKLELLAVISRGTTRSARARRSMIANVP